VPGEGVGGSPSTKDVQGKTSTFSWKRRRSGGSEERRKTSTTADSVTEIRARGLPSGRRTSIGGKTSFPTDTVRCRVQANNTSANGILREQKKTCKRNRPTPKGFDERRGGRPLSPEREKRSRKSLHRRSPRTQGRALRKGRFAYGFNRFHLKRVSCGWRLGGDDIGNLPVHHERKTSGRGGKIGGPKE